VTEPGGPRQRGRHSSADDGAAGVPGAHWTPIRDHGFDARPTNAYGVPAQSGRYPTDRTHTGGYATGGYATGGFRAGDHPAAGFEASSRMPVASRSGSATGGFAGVPGVLDRFPDQTGPVTEPAWWAYGSSDHPDYPLSARHSGEDRPGPGSWDPRSSGDLPGDTPREQYHPSAPLPPMPSGVWDRLRPRDDFDGHDDATLAHRPGGRAADDGSDVEDDAGRFREDDDRTDAHHIDPHDVDPHEVDPHEVDPHDVGPHDIHPHDIHPHDIDPHAWEDRTGGLEVIGAHVEDDGSRGRWRRRARRADRRDAHVEAHSELHPHEAGEHDAEDLERRPALQGFGRHGGSVAARYSDDHGDAHDDHRHAYDDHGHDHDHDDDIPVVPYDARGGRRRRRRPWAVLLSLVVLAGLVVGIVVGGGKLLSMFNLSSRDFSGQGTGNVQVRISQGDTLSDIARTLVDDGVVASVGPFVDAAEADPHAKGIQPGVYRLRAKMSGKSAVDLLLDPAARLVTRVLLPEGLTVKATLAKLAETTGIPVAKFEAAAADPRALGLPAYAGGKLEGFLFPATYDFEPDTTPADMLEQMVQRAVHAFDDLQIPAGDRLTVLTKASLVQAEASNTADMAKVARVLENRLADGMPLQLDTTVNYANGKSGITTTGADRKNPSPYNTYLHAGLPPGAIDNPGEEALKAVLSPAEGNWRFFVVVNPDTGETRFAATGAEHQQNVLLFQQWLKAHPGG